MLLSTQKTEVSSEEKVLRIINYFSTPRKGFNIKFKSLGQIYAETDAFNNIRISNGIITLRYYNIPKCLQFFTQYNVMMAISFIDKDNKLNLSLTYNRHKKLIESFINEVYEVIIEKQK